MAANGIVRVESRHSVTETVERAKALLSAKGIALFAVVDHSGEAAKAGLSMPDTKLLIFGAPKAGTPLMIAAPSVAIDLPLKLLIADEAGRTFISYNSADYVVERHGVPEELKKNIAAIEAIAKAVAE